jgi:dihydroorotate dehydrogenase (fumarate)
MPDLATRYLGLTLKNPLVASASPLTETLERLRQLEAAGVSAVVLRSLFEEQITLESLDLDRYLTRGTESFAEALTYLPDLRQYQLGPETYLELVRRAKQALRIPVIGSLNGVSSGGWLRYATLIEEAGADALELNIYYIPTEVERPAADVEDLYVGIVRKVKARIRIPLAVKLSPYFTALAHLATRLERAGADALVLFNRFYQPDFDLERLEVVPNLVLSSPHELRLRLLWAAVLYGRVRADVAITGGVHSAQDVLKAMMAGARVAMMTSALLANGPSHVEQVLGDLEGWMRDHEYDSIRQMQGSMSRLSVAEPSAFERANYMKALRSYMLRDEPDRGQV